MASSAGDRRPTSDFLQGCGRRGLDLTTSMAISAGDPVVESDDSVRLNAYGRVIRNTSTPDVAEQIYRIAFETDVRPVLPLVRAPTALVVGEVDQVEEVRYMASLM